MFSRVELQRKGPPCPTATAASGHGGRMGADGPRRGVSREERCRAMDAQCVLFHQHSTKINKNKGGALNYRHAGPRDTVCRVINHTYVQTH